MVGALMASFLLIQPIPLAAQFWEGVARGMEDNQRDRNSNSQRQHEREMLELKLEHERSMLRSQQEQNVRSQLQSGGYMVFQDIDFQGSDLTKSGIRNVSIELCIKICAENRNCVAVTWVKAKSWCFTKQRGYIKQLNQSVISVQIR